MPKIIDDAADELSNFLSVADHNNDELLESRIESCWFIHAFLPF